MRRLFLSVACLIVAAWPAWSVVAQSQIPSQDGKTYRVGGGPRDGASAFPPWATRR